MKRELTPVMKEALESARTQGEGKLHRHPGGYWSWNKNPPVATPYFSTPTIAGLRARGVLEYTEWRDGRGGLFPIEATLCSSDRT